MIDSILTFCDEVLSNPVWFYIITLLIKIVICFAITILFIPVCVYIERRVAAWIQDRVGPNRAGIPLSIFRRFGMKSDLPFKKTLDYFGLPHDGKIANLCRFFRLDRDIPIFGLVQPMVDGGKLKWEMSQTTAQAAAYGRASDTEGRVVLATNADYYNMQTGAPTGYLIMEGNLVKTGNEPFFAILKDGSAVIRPAGSDTSDVVEAVSGP